MLLFVEGHEIGSDLRPSSCQFHFHFSRDHGLELEPAVIHPKSGKHATKVALDHMNRITIGQREAIHAFTKEFYTVIHFIQGRTKQIAGTGLALHVRGYLLAGGRRRHEGSDDNERDDQNGQFFHIFRELQFVGFTTVKASDNFGSLFP